MSSKKNIGIFGGDMRQVYMAKAFLSAGYPVTTYCMAEEIHHTNCYNAHTSSELFEKSNILIGPIPMSKDQINIASVGIPSDLTIAHIAYLLKPGHILIGGNIPLPITELCNKRNICYSDLMSNEKITILNAIATAEGTIMEAILNSDRNLHRSKCLVLGYGRCAKVLAQKLKALDANVTVAARSKEALAYANSFGLNIIALSDLDKILPDCDYIFNTIPALILTKEKLNLIKQDSTIIDIASYPGGVDFDYAKKLNLTAKLCPALPGKVASKTSADILATEIIGYLKERSD